MGVRKVYWMGMALAALSLPLATQVIADTSVPVEVDITLASVTETPTVLDFGEILLDPTGNTVITFNNSSGVGAATADNNSVVTNAIAGSITYAASINTDLTVTIDDADAAISLTGGTGTVTVSHVSTNSEDGAHTHSADVDTVVYIGGQLNITDGSFGTWTGTIPVSLAFN